MILYMIRHGETDWNLQHKLQGMTDIPLNANGRRAAELTRDCLQNVKFDVAFSSPLIRAKETADIILEGRDVDIILDERIREVGFGTFEGTNSSEFAEGIKKFFTQPECFVATNGAESYESLLERERSFWNDLCTNPEYQDSTILLATHGAALNGLLCVIKEKEIADFWKCGLHKNCGMTIVEVTNGEAKFLQEAIILYNEKDL